MLTCEKGFECNNPSKPQRCPKGIFTYRPCAIFWSNNIFGRKKKKFQRKNFHERSEKGRENVEKVRGQEVGKGQNTTFDLDLFRPQGQGRPSLAMDGTSLYFLVNFL